MVVPLEMGWRHLLFGNWPVERDVLEPRSGLLTLDEFDGTAWLSVIPFINVAVRPAGLPECVGIQLPELNLRTYVTRDGTPGIYFFSLEPLYYRSGTRRGRVTEQTDSI
jgi:uncharacterized protein YqjF (DUF2071 family)